MSQKTILLVDDDADIRTMLAHRLARHGYRVLEARDGIEAFDQAMTHGPDLIIADVSMPGVDGFQLVETLLSQPYTKHIPCVFLTGRVDIADRVRGLRLGAYDYVPKPFAFDELLARVEGILARTDVQTQFDGVVRVGGRLEDVPVPDIIQTLEVNRRTGVLILLKGHDKAEVDLYEGRITYVRWAELEGLDALSCILPWNTGVFEFQDDQPRSKVPLAETNLELIMEAVRRLDESRCQREGSEAPGE
jgi:CheY-like chemotaxis protein